MKDTKFKRKFTEEERMKFVNEALQSGSNILISKKYDINPVLLCRWVCNYRRYGQTLEPKESKDVEVIPNYKKEYKKAMKKIQDQEIKIAILEDLLKKRPIVR